MATRYSDLSAALGVADADVYSAFTDAEGQLASIGASATYFMEIYYDGGSIRRRIDSAQISSLTNHEQLYYFKQLDQLFKLAYENRYF